MRNNNNMSTEQIYADISNLAYLRVVRNALIHMNIMDMDAAPAELQHRYGRCCADVEALRKYFEGCVNLHNEKEG